MNSSLVFLRSERWRTMYRKLFMKVLQLNNQIATNLKSRVIVFPGPVCRINANTISGMVSIIETEKNLMISTFLAERIACSVTRPALPIPAMTCTWAKILVCVRTMTINSRRGVEKNGDRCRGRDGVRKEGQQP
ncbi:hypothetical protein LSAT2_012376 [Lamellibrachia satsuma]|nr:hypothetical protein LSAT2_012376 [Lamellibrachia satsuma]